MGAADGADRAGHLVERDVLEQVAAGPGPDRLEQVVFLVADRQHDDLRARRDFLGRPARLDAAALRHPDVHEHHIGQRLAGHGHCLGPVAGLADDVDVVLFRENHLQATPEQGVIIGDQHPDGIWALSRPRPPGSRRRPVAHGAHFVASLGEHRPPPPHQAARLTMIGTHVM